MHEEDRTFKYHLNCFARYNRQLFTGVDLRPGAVLPQGNIGEGVSREERQDDVDPSVKMAGEQSRWNIQEDKYCDARLPPDEDDC